MDRPVLGHRTRHGQHLDPLILRVFRKASWPHPKGHVPQAQLKPLTQGAVQRAVRKVKWVALPCFCGLKLDFRRSLDFDHLGGDALGFEIIHEWMSASNDQRLFRHHRNSVGLEGEFA